MLGDIHDLVSTKLGMSGLFLIGPNKISSHTVVQGHSSLPRRESRRVSPLRRSKLACTYPFSESYCESRRVQLILLTHDHDSFGERM